MGHRVGVIGCGRWGSKHLQALKTIKKDAHIEQIVACDIDTNALNAVTGVELHDDPETLVGRFNLNAVVIATPNDTHYKLGLQFLTQGVDVFLEKPLATTFEHGSSLVSNSIQEGRILKSGFLLRFHPCVLDAHSRIRSGEIGAIQSVRYRKKTMRKGSPTSHALESLAIHGIDLAEFLLDGQTPLRISEVVGNRTNTELTLEYPNQVEIHVDVGWNAIAERSELEVLGVDGSFVIDLKNHIEYCIERDSSIKVTVESTHTPLEAVLLDFLSGNSASIAASTGSILRTIKCVEQARLKMVELGYSGTRELKR